MNNGNVLTLNTNLRQIQTKALLSEHSMSYGNQCGFLTNIYYRELQSHKEVENFAIKCECASISKKLWGQTRKLAKSALNSNFNYVNKGKDKKDYQAYFSAQNFELFNLEKRSKHTLDSCKECAAHHAAIWKTFRRNRLEVDTTPRKQEPTLLDTIANKLPVDVTPADVNKLSSMLRPAVNKINKTEHHKLFLKSLLGKKKVDTVSMVSKTCKRKILKEATDELRSSNKDSDFVALFSSKQSAAEWNRQRADSSSRYLKKQSTRSHTGTLDSYTHNNLKLTEILDQDTDTHCINWTKLSLDVNLKNQEGKRPANGGQVSQ